ncbi:chorismate mutase [Bacillus ectoiniformans]|uniref:chorismate mutase n=1 Tax=Bacillus ectoiniformans TaxID=1494429 RepID=UPI00195E0CB3|nr:chorismate mutase [Bacillus ectoiniformans]MBM7647989.1 chorismate mutase [Bacillus ectoiniformans]
MIRGVRGAATVDENNHDMLVDAAEQLLKEMISLNKIEAEDVCSIFISVTEDLDAAFPAKAIRKIEGWSYVPVICMKEIPVPGSLEKCVRIMMHVNTEVPQKDIQHVYQGKAVSLRPDLQKQQN